METETIKQGEITFPTTLLSDTGGLLKVVYEVDVSASPKILSDFDSCVNIKETTFRDIETNIIRQLKYATFVSKIKRAIFYKVEAEVSLDDYR